MKKKLAMALALTMGISTVAACGQSQPAPATTAAATEAAAETEAPAAEGETAAEAAEAGEESADKPYIEIPPEVQSWDESKKQVTRDMLTTAENGMVSSLNYVASKVGADILEAGGNAVKTGTDKLQVNMKSVFPWFILGFLALSALNSIGLIPAAAGSSLKDISKFLMVAALAAIGLNTSFRDMRKAGICSSAPKQTIWII